MRGICILLLGIQGCTWVSEADHQRRLALLDGDGDGYLDRARGGDDCDDSDPGVNPGASELCSTAYDDDCDGAVNEDDPDNDGWSVFVDADGDGFGIASAPVIRCDLDGYAQTADDCDDADASVYPGAPEECPGFGPDKDCSDAPRPCSLSADVLEVALSGPGVGERFVASTEHVVESGVGALHYYAPQQLIDGTRRADATLIELLDRGAIRPELSLLQDSVAVALPDEESVQRFDLEDRADIRSSVIESPTITSRGFGYGVASLLSEDGAAIVSVGERGGSNKELVLSTASNTSVVASRLDKGADGVAAGGSDEDAVVAVVASSSATPVSVYVQDQGEFSFVGNLGVGGAVGQAIAVADIDGDGNQDWVLGTDDGLVAYRGPIVGDQAIDDAWWRFDGLGRISSIVIGDLTDDGAPEIVAGASGGAGSVVVLRGTASSPAGADGTIWLRVSGTQEMGGLGSALGITRGRVDGQDRSVLLMGASGEERIRLLALPDAW
ncbi:MAG: MopE-related protein [Myxococcota bacterium]